MANEDPTAERWLPVVGYEGLYEVSDLGRIRSLDRPSRDNRGNFTRMLRGRIMRQPTAHDGYKRIGLTRDGVQKEFKPHRLVLEAFCRPAREGEDCNHKNFDRADNRLCNLEWVTRKENCQHAIAHGHVSNTRGESHGSSKLTNADVLEIRRRVASGETQRSVAAAFGVTASNVCVICSRGSWAHLNEGDEAA